ncbi:MAG TPA: hypothetical protein VF423_08200 [Actinomycetes bacterium]
MPDGSRTLLDDAMPSWDVAERHHRVVRAEAGAVWDALLTTPVGALPVTRSLMRVRTLGRSSFGSRDRPVVAALPPGEIARREPEQLLLGMVAPVSLRTGADGLEDLRAATVAELTRPLPDGWVRIAMDFRLVPDPAGPGTTALHTETRVLATGRRARRAFRAYWLVIRGGSGLIRHELLRAVSRRAEAAGG